MVQRKEVWSYFPQDLTNVDTTAGYFPQDPINLAIKAGKNQGPRLRIKGTQIRYKIEDKRTCYKKELRYATRPPVMLTV